MLAQLDQLGHERKRVLNRYSLEMHLVHWKTSYGDVATAKTKADGLAVLGILFKADHDYHEYEALEVKIKKNIFRGQI